MKKRTLPLVLLLAASLLGFAAAAGGDAGDPLVSLSYLQSVFLPKAGSAVQERLDASGDAVYRAVEAGLSGSAASGGGSWSELRLKQGDVLNISTGGQMLLLAGRATAQFDAGAVVDTTDGDELAAGAALEARHRYLAAESTSARFSVASRTAVVKYCGGFVSPSSNTPDYNAMASALKSLSLFRGTGTGYGSGFDLELAPTRIQALVMLIRLLGEEDAALAFSASQPFKDVPQWADRYVAYAYACGYTNGVSATQFAPNAAASAGMYVEFVLRALGYSDTTHTDVSTAAARALESGVLTSGEKMTLEANDFLRSDVVYLSWYALDTPLCGETRLLREKLAADGVFSAEGYAAAAAGVTSARL